MITIHVLYGSCFAVCIPQGGGSDSNQLLLHPWSLLLKSRPGFLFFSALPIELPPPYLQPHFSAAVSTEMISSMETPSSADRITKLSMVGIADPWIHL